MSDRAVTLRRLAARREADARRCEADAAALRRLADEIDGGVVSGDMTEIHQLAAMGDRRALVKLLRLMGAAVAEDDAEVRGA